MDEILINKKTSIERCIKRIHEDFQDDFISNYTKQDAVILNIERACQAAIDMGNRVLKIKKLGLPQSNRNTFEKLEKEGIISIQLSNSMKSMAGFRNMAVHDYSSLNLEVIINIIQFKLDDLLVYCDILLGQN